MRTVALTVFTTLCLAVTGTAFAADAPDTEAPELNNLTVTNKIFKVGDKNTALITKAKKKKVPVGTKIKFDLIESAYISIGVYKALEGRTVGTDCVKPDDTNKDAKKCVRPVYINTIQRIGKPGPNAITFTGKLDGKKLKTGAYAFGIIATDEAKNSTKIVLKNFIIVSGR